MKHGKNPTLEQKNLLQANGLKPYMWLVVKNLPNSLIVTHRVTGEFKVLEKGRKLV